jgi:hypothetical protein
MSLYRQPGRRSVGALVAVGVVALVIGGVVGYLIGHNGQSSPTLTAGLANVQKTVRPAVDGIELVGVEYPIGVKDGKVAVPEQLQGAKDQLAKVRATFAKAKPELTVLDPDATTKVSGDLDQLQAKVAALAASAEVSALVTQIETELRQLARLS